MNKIIIAFERKAVKKLWKSLLIFSEKPAEFSTHFAKIQKTKFTKLWINKNFTPFFHSHATELFTGQNSIFTSINQQVFHILHRAYYCVLLFLIKKGDREKNFAK